MNITNIPAPRVGFIDERTGLMSREWYRFFLNLFTLTGSGTTSISTADLQVEPVGFAPAIENQIADMAARYEQALDALDLMPVQLDRQPHDDLAPAVQIGTLGAQNADRVAITGGTVSATVTTPGGATLITTASALTDNAAAAAGTLLNAPAAGNPAKWIALDDNGTTRYIPTW